MERKPLDQETGKILRILEAAERKPRDPDIELATMLAELSSPSSGLDDREVLRRLAENAR